MSLDYSLFFSLHSLFPHNLFFDWLFSIISSLGHPNLIWPPLVIGFLLFHHQKRGWVLLEAALAMGIGVVINELILKDIFARVRPFELFSDIPAMDISATGFSFLSTHTIATFSLITIIALATKNWKIYLPFLGYALLVGYSRIYLGAHFPLDVIGGAFFGIVVGWFIARFFPPFYKTLFPKKR